VAFDADMAARKVRLGCARVTEHVWHFESSQKIPDELAIRSFHSLSPFLVAGYLKVRTQSDTH
jgi:hypothetical protein